MGSHTSYLSAMLPLVRQHEYEIFKCLINGVTEAAQIQNHLADNVGDYLPEQFDYAMKFMIENGFVSLEDNHCCFHDVDIDEQFKEYLDDLLSYGLTRYTVDYGTETGFKLWNSYRMDQVQLKLLRNHLIVAVLQ